MTRWRMTWIISRGRENSRNKMMIWRLEWVIMEGSSKDMKALRTTREWEGKEERYSSNREVAGHWWDCHMRGWFSSRRRKRKLRRSVGSFQGFILSMDVFIPVVLRFRIYHPTFKFVRFSTSCFCLQAYRQDCETFATVTKLLIRFTINNSFDVCFDMLNNV